MEELDQAKNLLLTNIESGIEALKNLLQKDYESSNVRIKEPAILALGEALAKSEKSTELAALIEEIRPLFSDFPKAKIAKIVKSLIEFSALIPNSADLQMKLCQDSIAWCKAERRTFLKQRLETKLAQLYFENQRYPQAIQTLQNLLHQVRKLDDKLQLVEIQLIQSKVYQKLQNIPRSKAALTAARSCANAIYCPPMIQADIDMVSGTLNCQQKDYRTGYSYFFEAYQGFNSIDDPRALNALKCMLLAKIMSNRPEDVNGLIQAKGGVKYTGRQIDSMNQVAESLKNRSLHDFQRSLNEYSIELEGDPVVAGHIQELYDTMLEQHLIRIIEPFSKVEIEHIAELIELPLDVVMNKLSQMILDKKFQGTLDQGIGCLIVYDEPPASTYYSTALKYLEALNGVVDSLFEKAIQSKTTN